MDTNEKLSLFRDMVFEHAEEEVDEQVTTFENSLRKILEDHKSERISKKTIELETEKENVRKESNKQVAQLQLQMQRDLHKQQQQLKEEVFNQVQNRLNDYMKTDDYMNLLETQISDALKIAGDNEIVIYLNSADADKVETLEQRTGHSLDVSSRPFIGGIRGVIQSRNMLIDYSFLKRLEAERDNFSFDITEEEDGM